MSLEIARDAAELQRLLQRRPFFRMQQFAEHLGWRGLRMERCWLREQLGNLPAGAIIVYYMTTDARFHIQINESPTGQWETYRAIVIAERYGLLPTPFHDFRLGNDDLQLNAEAERLAPYLSRANFRSKAWRSQIRRSQPERFYPVDAIGWKRKC